jgi:hypothetical protein
MASAPLNEKTRVCQSSNPVYQLRVEMLHRKKTLENHSFKKNFSRKKRKLLLRFPAQFGFSGG